MSWVCFEEVLIHLLCGKLFFIHFWILFVMGLEQIPGMNLQMSISTKVDNIMTKMAWIQLNWSNFCIFLLFWNMTTNHKTVQLSFTMAAILETILDLYFQLSELKTQLIMTNVKDRNKKRLLLHLNLCNYSIWQQSLMPWIFIIILGIEFTKPL